MEKIQRIGVIGLGNMGRGMALSLARAGFGVAGFDNGESATLAARAAGIAVADGLPALAATCDAFVLSLPTSAIVKAVLFGANGKDGLAALLKPGTLIVDTTTADPQATRAMLPALGERGLRFVDAPVSGGAAGAQKGQLTMFIGGAPADLDLAEPVLAAMGSKRFTIGAAGAGHTAKLINNLLVASHLLTAADAFRLSEAAGVPIGQIIEAVNAGSGRSGVTQYNYPSRIMNGAFDSGFTMQLMRKDVGLAMTLAEQLALELPLAREVGRRWKESAALLADGEDFNRITQLQ